jgi:DNA-binding XRE family transcriptional regulator
MSVQVIEHNGKPEWAVLPYQEYLKLVEQSEMLEDIQDFDSVKEAVENGIEETIPARVVNALLDGKSPIKVWREYRGLTQQQLAEAAGISIPFLSQIETGKRKPSVGVLLKIASTLRLGVDDLLQE